jgi:hypothetical protein
MSVCVFANGIDLISPQRCRQKKPPGVKQPYLALISVNQSARQAVDGLFL